MNAVIVAVIELLWFLPLFLRQGKKDAVSKKYTVFAMLLGMTLGMVLGVVIGIGGLLKKVLAVEENSIAAIVISAFLTAAFPEETSKFICGWLMLKRAKPVRKLDYIYIIGGAGLGFGIIESMMYATSGAAVIIRFLEPLHLMWQLRMGEHYYEFLQAKRSGNKSIARKEFFMAYPFPVLMHGVHDCVALGIAKIPGSATGEISASSAVILVIFLLWNIGMVVYSVLTEIRVAGYVRESRKLDDVTV